MKLISPIAVEDAGFKPFQITIEIDSAPEARLLFHTLNVIDLAGALKDTPTCKNAKPDLAIAQSFDGDDKKIRTFIKQHVDI